MAKIPGYGNVPRSVKMIGVKSEVPVEINPSPERIAEIVANRKPVLIRGCKIGQCTEKWTAEYLKTKCIESKVSVRISKQPILDFINKNYEFIKVAFPEFMDKVFTEQTENSNDRYYFRSIGENPRKDVSDDIWRSFPDLAADFEIPEQFSFIKVCAANLPKWHGVIWSTNNYFLIRKKSSLACSALARRTFACGRTTTWWTTFSVKSLAAKKSCCGSPKRSNTFTSLVRTCLFRKVYIQQTYRILSRLDFQSSWHW